MHKSPLHGDVPVGDFPKGQYQLSPYSGNIRNFELDLAYGSYVFTGYDDWHAYLRLKGNGAHKAAYYVENMSAPSNEVPFLMQVNSTIQFLYHSSEYFDALDKATERLMRRSIDVQAQMAQTMGEFAFAMKETTKMFVSAVKFLKGLKDGSFTGLAKKAPRRKAMYRRAFKILRARRRLEFRISRYYYRQEWLKKPKKSRGPFNPPPLRRVTQAEIDREVEKSLGFNDQSMTSSYLAYVFCIDPTFQAVKDTISLIPKPLQRQVRATEEYTYKVPSNSHDIESKQRLRVTAIVSLTPEQSAIEALGYTSLPALAWELLPMSFIVDTIIDIGSIINRLFFDFTRWSKSARSIKHKVSVTPKPYNTLVSGWDYKDGRWVYVDDKNRTETTGWKINYEAYEFANVSLSRFYSLNGVIPFKNLFKRTSGLKEQLLTYTALLSNIKGKL